MARWQFTKGLHDLGNGHAWLQPNGGWVYSDSGLIADEGETLLVDTLFDLAHSTPSI
jgi:cyclase